MFRLITPVLITIALFILTDIKTDVAKLDAHFTNHLFHHQDLEVGYERRLSCIEQKIKTNEKQIDRITK